MNFAQLVLVRIPSVSQVGDLAIVGCSGRTGGVDRRYQVVVAVAPGGGDTVAVSRSREATTVVVGSRIESRSGEFDLMQTAGRMVGSIDNRTIGIGVLGEFASGVVLNVRGVGLASDGERFGGFATGTIEGVGDGITVAT